MINKVYCYNVATHNKHIGTKQKQIHVLSKL